MRKGGPGDTGRPCGSELAAAPTPPAATATTTHAATATRMLTRRGSPIRPLLSFGTEAVYSAHSSGSVFEFDVLARELATDATIGVGIRLPADERQHPPPVGDHYLDGPVVLKGQPQAQQRLLVIVARDVGLGAQR